MGTPESVDVIVTGGGPAGMMAGLLFARAGVETLVLEKHADFLRDFRGDTVHPSTMEILCELGLLERFLDRPHKRLDRAEISWNGRKLMIGDLSHLKTPAPFIAMMPQWEFLDFLRNEAETYPEFSLALETPAAGIRARDGRYDAVLLEDGSAIEARKLVIMADGRDSLVRRQEILPLEDLGVPIDVFWFRVPKTGEDRAVRGAIHGNHMVVLIDRGDFWQCAFVIGKGKAETIRDRGIEAFRRDIVNAAPDLEGLEDALPNWDPVKLLSVSLDRLTLWHKPGLLAIGDAAHAMSPVGGIGINLAIQDAVAAANILAGPISQLDNGDRFLARVQKRRLYPARVIQRGQQIAHENLLRPVISGRTGEAEPPLLLKLLDRIPLLRRIPGRLIGLGIRREHVRAPSASAR
ncbi:MAG TPA: FAD-dependent oxidoreductase [Gammaproteobacteria bacterium]|nr:FAD-dependent oxidoreductase [Gammaproteobacteria bacterium]